MKKTGNEKGSVFRCPVCGAEIVVLVKKYGTFEPVCCNVKMRKLSGRLAIYKCPVCGAEITVLTRISPMFIPRCCNTRMVAA